MASHVICVALVLCAAAACLHSCNGEAIVTSNNLSTEAGVLTQLMGAETEAEALTALSNAQLKLDKDIGRSFIDFAMSRGYFALAGEVVKQGRAAGLDFSTAVHQSADGIRKKLQALTESLQQVGAPEGIPPAFQWAQSPESVFLNVKFAHKWDTPATLGCEEELVSITNSTVLFGVTCKEKKKKFLLTVDTHAELAPENCTWSMSSVGRAMFTLQKSVAMTWPRLLKGSKKPGNMHVWWEMHERYEAENKANVDEVKLALKKRKEENASKADKGADVEVETTTPTLTPTPTPLVDKRKLSLEKELTKKRKAVDTKLKDELGAVDANARARKKAIDESASQQKERVDEEAAKNRTAIESKFAAERASLDAEHESKVSALPPLDDTNNVGDEEPPASEL